MKKTFLFFVVMMLCIVLSAQTQQGYVKTKGRMVNGKLVPGQGLIGATVFIKGRTTILVKADDGAFSFPVPEAQFRVDSVRKKGYQLVDMDFCYKTRKYSSTPIDILMEIPGQSIEDYLEDFNRINASQQTLISQLRAEVKQLKAQNKINEEEFSRRLSEIAEMQNKSQTLVSEMAERYSKMDFDRLDDFNRQISWLILKGDLIKADSLIKSKGSMTERSAELDNLHKANMEVRADLEKSEQLEAKTLEVFAADCYNLHKICKLKHENDSAAYWLELRASKDTTNIEWLNDAGEFFDYLGDYNLALTYFQAALQQCLEQSGEQNEYLSILYDNIGVIHKELGDYDTALRDFEKALSIACSLYGETHIETSEIYSNLGTFYRLLENYPKALECHEKSLAIRKSILGEVDPKIAINYNNIGVVYESMGEYEKALECHEKSLIIVKQLFGEDHPSVANSYGNIGIVYKKLRNYVKALEYQETALQIRKTVFGENHPDVAFSYNDLGNVYSNLEEHTKALECHKKSLSIFKSFFGEKHPSIATCYANVGSSYSDLGEFERALEYQTKALELFKAFFGENYSDVATCYNAIGITYSKLGDYALAQENFERALAIFKVTLGEDHPYVAIVYSSIASICNKQAKYDQGLEYEEQALAINLIRFGENSLNVAENYFSIGVGYEKKGDITKALEYYEKSLLIRESILGFDDSETNESREAVEDMKALLNKQ